MRVLNLYAGLGGNRKKWKGVRVTAVENNVKIAGVYQKLNPLDEVIIGDAHQYLLDHFREFEFIWGSPPCQSHTRMVNATRHDTAGYIDMSLYQEIIFLNNFFPGKWVIENVIPYYKPLIAGQAVGRHLFWSNYLIPKISFAPRAFDFTIEGRQAFKEWLGIDFDENIYYNGNHDPGQVLRNCVHPDLGLHVFNAAFSGQTSLFENDALTGIL